MCGHRVYHSCLLSPLHQVSIFPCWQLIWHAPLFSLWLCCTNSELLPPPLSPVLRITENQPVYSFWDIAITCYLLMHVAESSDFGPWRCQTLFRSSEAEKCLVECITFAAHFPSWFCRACNALVMISHCRNAQLQLISLKTLKALSPSLIHWSGKIEIEFEINLWSKIAPPTPPITVCL